MENKTKKGISGSTLKIIAIVTMLIDHIGIVILERILNAGFANAAYMTATEYAEVFEQYKGVYYALIVMRQGIGRIAFPIFCFLLVEGFLHTKDVKKYLLRMCIFALITEIPFDLAIFGTCFYWDYQNVYFTLIIGLVLMMIFSWLDKQEIPGLLKLLAKATALGAGIYLAILLKTDYDGIGVACIMALYIFRNNKVTQTIAGCVAFLWEYTAPLAFIPIWFYNGKRGLKMKYVFYAFYPLHFLVLYFIACLLKLA